MEGLKAVAAVAVLIGATACTPNASEHSEAPETQGTPTASALPSASASPQESVSPQASTSPSATGDPNVKKFEPWPNAKAEKKARAAAVLRSTCELIGVTVPDKPLPGQDSNRDSLVIEVKTTRDPERQKLITPYENYLDQDGKPIPELGQDIPENATKNPHSSRVHWAAYKTMAQVIGSPPVQKTDNPKDWVVRDNSAYTDANDTSETTTFGVIPTNNYDRGSRMNISLLGRAESMVSITTETDKADGSEVRIVSKKVTTVEVDCGQLVQTGDRVEGAAGWVVNGMIVRENKPVEVTQETRLS